jgi:hypothetical protein
VKPGSRLAIYHPPGRIGPKANPFGKDVANLQLYQALARHGGYARVDLLSNLPVADADIAEDLFPGARPPCLVAGGSVLSVEAPTEGGILFRGQPDLETLAWIRRKATGDRGYSLAGLIHTLAPPAHIVLGVCCRARAVQKSDAVGVGRRAAYARSCELIHFGACACVNSPDHVRRPHPAAPSSVCATNFVRPIAPLVCLEEVRRAALRASSGA